MRSWLARRAVRAARVLVVECPGSWAVRVAVERAVRARGWRLALSPASADVLVVTEVDLTVEGDTKAPEITPEFAVTDTGEWQVSSKGPRFRIVTWRRSDQLG